MHENIVLNLVVGNGFNTAKIRRSAPGVYYIFKFFTRVLVGRGRLFNFSKIKELIIFCIHLYEANKLLSRYIFVKCDKELLDNTK